MKRASIKTAILIPSLAVLIAGVLTVILVVGVLSKNSTDSLTARLLDARVNQYSNEFRAFSEEIYGSVAALTPIIAGISEVSDSYEEPNAREEVIAVLSRVLTSSDKITSAWTVWEPNAFDGKDFQFRNTLGHDSTGRFVTCAYKSGSGTDIMAIEGYDDPIAGDFYQGVKKSGMPYATDPYTYDFNGTEIMLYTIAMPILRNGQVVGAVGVDINLQSVVTLMNAGKILDDGYLITLSPNGIITTHPNTDLLLDHYDTGWMAGYKTELSRLATQGGQFAVTTYSDKLQANIRYLAASTKIGTTDNYWTICGIIPEKSVTADSTALLLIIIVIGTALILLAGATIYFVVHRRLRELPNLTKVALAITTGDLSDTQLHRYDGSTQNEIALLSNAFVDMVAGIQQQAHVLGEFAQGDYTASITLRSEQDVMNRSIDHMLNMTNETLQSIREAAGQVSGGAQQISEGAQSLAQGATEQAATVEELSASIEEVATQTEQNANLAKQAAQLSDIIKKNAEKGDTQMGSLMDAVKAISESGNQIKRINKVIDDIAFQTNILALNAAVEAARAGQHGKGFAVVADEVRNLAAKSAAAAKDAEDLVADSISKSDMGFSLAKETVTSLQDIVMGVKQSVDIINNIAQSSEEQAHAISTINIGIDQVARVVQENSAMAEQSAAASEEMSSQSMILEKLVNKFKLKS